MQELSAEDHKIITLARSARVRAVHDSEAVGAAVRDDTGRTYVATPVRLGSISVSAVQAAVIAAVSSGAAALEAAAVVTASGSIDDIDVAAVADVGGQDLIFIRAAADGSVQEVRAL